MTTTKKKSKHGAASRKARALKAKYPDMSFAELGRKSGLSTQGARNAVLCYNRIGSKKLMRAEALTPNKLHAKKAA